MKKIILTILCVCALATVQTTAACPEEPMVYISNGVICEAELPINIGDTTFDVGSTVVFIEYRRQNGDGCDEIYRTTLSVIPMDSIFIDKTICEGETYTDDYFSKSEAGQYFIRLGSDFVPNPLGCSVLVLNLTVENCTITNTTQTMADKAVAGYYSILGTKLDEMPERGVFIILYTDSSKEKVVR